MHELQRRGPRVIPRSYEYQKKAAVISHSGLAGSSGVSSYFSGPGFGCGNAILHDREIPGDSVPADVKRIGFTRLSVRSGVRLVIAVVELCVIRQQNGRAIIRSRLREFLRGRDVLIVVSRRAVEGNRRSSDIRHAKRLTVVLDLKKIRERSGRVAWHRDDLKRGIPDR